MIRLCIDPGHGGENPGIVRGWLVEKEINLVLAKQLRDSLLCVRELVAVDLTRDDDWGVHLEDRGQISDDCGSDLVISIHVNGHKRTHVHGADVFYAPGDRVAADVARTIAHAMPQELRTGRVWEATSKPGDPSTSWLQRPYNVLRPHSAPAVLVECGYASNLSDQLYLRKPWALASIVNAIRAGVCRYSKWAS